jgi:hypothetical protein
MKPTYIIVALLVISNLFAISACNSKGGEKKPTYTEPAPVEPCDHGDHFDHDDHGYDKTLHSKPANPKPFSIGDQVEVNTFIWKITGIKKVDGAPYYAMERNDFNEKGQGLHITCQNVHESQMTMFERK